MTSQYGAYALRTGLARLYARMRMHTPTRPGIPRTHARTRKHAYTNQYVTLIAFPQQKWFRERASVLSYTHIGCPVLHILSCLDKDIKNFVKYLQCTRSWMISSYITSIVLLVFTLYILNMIVEGYRIM